MCTYIHFVSQVNIYVYIFIVHEQYVYSMYVHVPDLFIILTPVYVMCIPYTVYYMIQGIYTRECACVQCTCTQALYTGTLTSVFCMTVYIYVCMYVCMYILYVYTYNIIYIYIYTCSCIYTNRMDYNCLTCLCESLHDSSRTTSSSFEGSTGDVLSLF